METGQRPSPFNGELSARERFKGIKVLPLEFASAYFKGDMLAYKFFRDRYEKELRLYGKPMPVVVGRDGLYLKGAVCWYEFEGRGWLYPSSQFKYQMGLLEAAHNLVYRKELEAIYSTKLATKKFQGAI